MNKTILYYTCNTHRMDIELACRKQLLKANLPIVSVSREKEIDFGDIRIVLQGERSPLMMHIQILTGLKAIETDTVFMCENDVLYHPLHFNFIPEKEDIIYYNTNVWKTRYPDGHCIWTDNLQQISGICANKDLLLSFFDMRVKQLKTDGFNRHYEPNERYDLKTENWLSEYPNLDIRHDNTITKSKWSINDFRNKKYAKGWKEASEIPGWGIIEDNLLMILENI